MKKTHFFSKFREKNAILQLKRLVFNQSSPVNPISEQSEKSFKNL